jgi:hypothetical protein
LKDECGICGRVLRYSYLRKCQRCGKLYCRDCMVPDVATGDPTMMMCLNCARRTVAPRTAAKYEGLGGYLKFRGSFTDTVRLGFARIDGIIGDNLPMDAYKSAGWWDNTSSRLHAKAWLEAGWEVQEVNLKEGYVVFKKEGKPPDQEVFHASTCAHSEVEDAFEDEGFKTLRKNQEFGKAENGYAFLSWEF